MCLSKSKSLPRRLGTIVKGHPGSVERQKAHRSEKSQKIRCSTDVLLGVSVCGWLLVSSEGVDPVSTTPIRDEYPIPPLHIVAHSGTVLGSRWSFVHPDIPQIFIWGIPSRGHSASHFLLPLHLTACRSPRNGGRRGDTPPVAIPRDAAGGGSAMVVCYGGLSQKPASGC